MTESLGNAILDDEEAFIAELPDVALEIAASKLCEGPAGSVTLSFCSGYDTCPWERRL